MKAYKVEILIINHDELSEEEIITEVENASYPNDCITPHVMSIESKEIGEWRDDHPLNHNMKEEYSKMFK